jgi:hypothetical protein
LSGSSYGSVNDHESSLSTNFSDSTIPRSKEWMILSRHIKLISVLLIVSSLLAIGSIINSPIQSYQHKANLNVNKASLVGDVNEIAIEATPSTDITIMPLCDRPVALSPIGGSLSPNLEDPFAFESSASPTLPTVVPSFKPLCDRPVALSPIALSLSPNLGDPCAYDYVYDSFLTTTKSKSELSTSDISPSSDVTMMPLCNRPVALSPISEYLSPNLADPCAYESSATPTLPTITPSLMPLCGRPVALSPISVSLSPDLGDPCASDTVEDSIITTQAKQ